MVPANTVAAAPLERAAIQALETDLRHAPSRAARGQVRRAVRAWLTAPDGTRGLVLSAADLCGSPLLVVGAELAGAAAEVVLDYGPDSQSVGAPQSDYSVKLQGSLTPMTEVPALGRYIARFASRHRLEPGAMQDGGGALYQLQVSAAELCPSEGDSIGLETTEYLLDYGDAPDHTQREWDNLAHQNYQHLDINEQLVTQMLALPAGRWLLTGLDPEGMDFRLGETFCRLPFPEVAITQKQMGAAIKLYLAEARRRLNINP
ncbi:MAG: hypothetical protein V2J12_13025 [Gammaproteobacteria bacterium]|jgi:hypothetical protein|nr:hypothetical protein [Gammaproteobacteria bacterium]